MTLSMEHVPVLPADVRLRVLATALDPDAPPVPDTLVPADTLDGEPAPAGHEQPAVLDEPYPRHPADDVALDLPEPAVADQVEDPLPDDLW